MTLKDLSFSLFSFDVSHFPTILNQVTLLTPSCTFQPDPCTQSFSKAAFQRSNSPPIIALLLVERFQWRAFGGGGGGGGGVRWWVFAETKSGSYVCLLCATWTRASGAESPTVV